MKTNTRSAIFSLSLCSYVAAMLLMGGLVGLLATPVGAQDTTEQHDLLEEAKDEYLFADYDRAIELFSEIAYSDAYDSEMRIEAFRYLGRSHIAKDNEEEAREAMAALIELEPPIVELDADEEPPPLINIYYDVRSDVQGSYEVERADPGLQTLAVMDFANNSIDDRERFEGLSKGLPSMMINYMNGGVDLRVVERERIQWLLNEIDLQSDASVVDQSTAVRTGELLGVNAVVFGSFIVHEDDMRLMARVVEVETGEIILGEEVTGEADAFFTLIEELSNKVSGSINVELDARDAEEPAGTQETNSLEAMLAYSEGLQRLESGDYQGAFDKFMEATTHDGDFAHAVRKAESLRPVLALSGSLRDEDMSLMLHPFID